MLIKGKYNTAKVFTDVIDDGAVEQIKDMCDFEPFKDLKIRIMPDVHAGAGCTIGTAMNVKDKIIPNMVGVDIGCGMELVQIKQKAIDFDKLDKLIHEEIPAGMTCRDFPHPYAEQTEIEKLKCAEHINLKLARLSVGTLGGGNHFIEVDKDCDGNLYIVVHSGSRHMGLEIANYYQNEAYAELCGSSSSQIEALIAKLKAEGREREIQAEIARKKAFTPNISRDFAYAEGELFNAYIHDMKIAQEYAILNRKAILEVILQGMGFDAADGFTTIHNYIDTEHMILRKGAVSAQKGERLLIPVNMRDGSLICVGKGNEDWNCSAPHGAGRILSRGKARAELTVDEFEKQMKGIYTTCVCEETLDESPMAYKTMENIVDNISPTADIVKRILPVYNFKSAESALTWRKKRK